MNNKTDEHELNHEDWTKDEAKALYQSKELEPSELDIDCIHFMDCVEGMKQLPSECVDLVIADPPFGIDFTKKESLYARDESFVAKGYREVISDYYQFTVEWMTELPRIMKSTSTAYVFSGWNNLESVLRAAKSIGLTLINHIIWHYQFGPYTKRKFVTSHYHNLMLVKDPLNYYFNEIEESPDDVWYIKRKYRHGLKKNATAMPIELVTRCIDFSTRPGDLVLDPFMGNGTTSIAAKANYRHYIGFEINTQLTDIINSNLGEFIPGQDYTPYQNRQQETE